MEYPKYIYLKQENKAVVVKDSAAEARYGQEDVDYSQRPWPADKVVKPEEPVNAECPSCNGLQKNLGMMTRKFDAAFGQVTQERDAAIAERDAALQQLAEAKAAKPETAPAEDAKPKAAKK